MCESEVTTLVGQGREYIKEMTKSVIAQLSCTMKLISWSDNFRCGFTPFSNYKKALNMASKRAPWERQKDFPKETQMDADRNPVEKSRQAGATRNFETLELSYEARARNAVGYELSTTFNSKKTTALFANSRPPVQCCWPRSLLFCEVYSWVDCLQMPLSSCSISTCIAPSSRLQWFDLVVHCIKTLEAQ